MPGRTVRAANLGLWLGWLAGAMVALVDYGAHWLWVDRWEDRAGLLLRLLGLQSALGALLGGVLGAIEGATQPQLERIAGRWCATGLDRLAALGAARWLVVASPAIACVAHLLFSGGKMSRLTGRAWLEGVALVALSMTAWALLYAAQRIDLRTRARPGVRSSFAALAAGSAFALAKLNQWVLPKLYDYLHASLALGSWSLLLAAAYLLLTRRPRTDAAQRRWPTLVSLCAGLALAGSSLAGVLARLEQNQNVRVALLHPNMPHARSSLQALAPWVLEPAQRRATERARLLARRARTQTRAAAPSHGPVLDDAHILLVTIDALRADHLGSYGYARPTSPNFDRLANESVIFERAYAPAPHSSFSLCSLMTSEFLHETLDLGNPAPTETLATALARAGYHTASFYTDGIFHTAAERLRGYEHDAFGFALHDQVKYSAEDLTDRVLLEADRTMARGEPSSLFWVHYFDVHEPYQDTHFGNSDLDRYDSEIRHVDAQLERLIRELRRRLTRDVIVVVSADHGEEFYEHGGVYHGSSLYEEQLRVPLLIHAPGLTPRRIATPVTSIDLAPTLLHWVGLEAPPSMRGSDLRPLATGTLSSNGPVFAAVTHKKMVLRWPHKLIADLRFGLFELYDLERDPHERANLADLRPDLLVPLRDEIYGWLDSLTPAATDASDAWVAALDRGRLGDRRAVDPLAALLRDPHASSVQRVEAARTLGNLADDRANESLLASLTDFDPAVAAESAIALGHVNDARAREPLQRLVLSEDPALRTRAALSLASLHDTHAVPALVESLWVAPSDYDRQESVRWLGRLGDRRALEPLIRLLPETRTRYLVPVALGMLGDPRAFPPLADLLRWDNHADVRDATLQGLGQLGDPTAIALILPLALDEPSLKLASESLVRLGAIARGAIGGADVGNAARDLHDFVDCHDGPLIGDGDYLHRTVCRTRSERAALWLAVPEAVARAAGGVVVLLSVKSADSTSRAPLELSLGAHALPPVEVDGGWQEQRWEVPAGTLPSGRVLARISSSDPTARFVVDHILLLPRASQALARH